MDRDFPYGGEFMPDPSFWRDEPDPIDFEAEERAQQLRADNFRQFDRYQALALCNRPTRVS